MTRSADFGRIRALSTPVDEWYGFINYESAWSAALCEPEPEPATITAAKLRVVEAENRELKQRLIYARQILAGR